MMQYTNELWPDLFRVFESRLFLSDLLCGLNISSYVYGNGT